MVFRRIHGPVQGSSDFISVDVAGSDQAYVLRALTSVRRYQYTNGGETWTLFGSGVGSEWTVVSNANGVAFWNGRMYVTDGTHITKAYTAGGVRDSNADLVGSSNTDNHGLAVYNGSLYVLNNSTIVRHNTDGTSAIVVSHGIDNAVSLAMKEGPDSAIMYMIGVSGDSELKVWLSTIGRQTGLDIDLGSDFTNHNGLSFRDGKLWVVGGPTGAIGLYMFDETVTIDPPKTLDFGYSIRNTVQPLETPRGTGWEQAPVYTVDVPTALNNSEEFAVVSSTLAYIIDNDSPHRIRRFNPQTGALYPSGNITLTHQSSGLAVTDDRIFYSSNSADDTIYSLNRDGEDARSQVFASIAGVVGGMAVYGGQLFVVSNNHGVEYRVDWFDIADDGHTLEHNGNFQLPFLGTNESYRGIAVTDDRIFVSTTLSDVRAYDRAGTRTDDDDLDVPRNTNPNAVTDFNGMSYHDGHLWTRAVLGPVRQYEHRKIINWRYVPPRHIFPSGEVQLPQSVARYGDHLYIGAYVHNHWRVYRTNLDGSNPTSLFLTPNGHAPKGIAVTADKIYLGLETGGDGTEEDPLWKLVSVNHDGTGEADVNVFNQFGTPESNIHILRIEGLAIHNNSLFVLYGAFNSSNVIRQYDLSTLRRIDAFQLDPSVQDVRFEGLAVSDDRIYLLTQNIIYSRDRSDAINHIYSDESIDLSSHGTSTYEGLSVHGDTMYVVGQNTNQLLVLERVYNRGTAGIPPLNFSYAVRIRAIGVPLPSVPGTFAHDPAFDFTHAQGIHPAEYLLEALVLTPRRMYITMDNDSSSRILVFDGNLRLTSEEFTLSTVTHGLAVNDDDTELYVALNQNRIRRRNLTTNSWGTTYFTSNDISRIEGMAWHQNRLYVMGRANGSGENYKVWKYNLADDTSPEPEETIDLPGQYTALGVSDVRFYLADSEGVQSFNHEGELQTAEGTGGRVATATDIKGLSYSPDTLWLGSTNGLVRAWAETNRIPATNSGALNFSYQIIPHIEKILNFSYKILTKVPPKILNTSYTVRNRVVDPGAAPLDTAHASADLTLGIALTGPGGMAYENNSLLVTYSGQVRRIGLNGQDQGRAHTITGTPTAMAATDARLYFGYLSGDVREHNRVNNASSVLFTTDDPIEGLALYDGNLWILTRDDSNNAVLRTTPANNPGIFTTVPISGGFANPRGVTVRDGRFYLARPGLVRAYDHSGNQIADYLGPNSANGLTYNNGTIYVLSGNTLRSIVLDRASSTLDFQYHVRNLVTKTLDFSWNIIEEIRKTLDFSYIVRRRVSKELDFPYHVRNNVAPKILDFAWSVCTKVPPKVLNFGYSIRQKVRPRYEALTGAFTGAGVVFNGTTGMDFGDHPSPPANHIARLYFVTQVSNVIRLRFRNILTNGFSSDSGLAQSPILDIPSAAGLAIDRERDIVYVAGPNSIYAYNLQGVRQTIVPALGSPTGLAIDPDAGPAGTLYYYTDGDIYLREIDPDTGLPGSVEDTSTLEGLPTGIDGLAVSPSHFYIHDDHRVRAIRRFRGLSQYPHYTAGYDEDEGPGGVVLELDSTDNIVGMAYDPGEERLVVAYYDSSNTYRYRTYKHHTLKLNFAYTVRTRISKALNFSWSFIDAITKTLDFSWSVARRVSKPLNFQYHVRKRIANTIVDTGSRFITTIIQLGSLDYQNGILYVGGTGIYRRVRLSDDTQISTLAVGGLTCMAVIGDSVYFGYPSQIQKRNLDASEIEDSIRFTDKTVLAICRVENHLAVLFSDKTIEFYTADLQSARLDTVIDGAEPTSVLAYDNLPDSNYGADGAPDMTFDRLSGAPVLYVALNDSIYAIDLINVHQIRIFPTDGDIATIPQDTFRELHGITKVPDSDQFYVIGVLTGTSYNWSTFEYSLPSLDTSYQVRTKVPEKTLDTSYQVRTQVRGRHPYWHHFETAHTQGLSPSTLRIRCMAVSDTRIFVVALDGNQAHMYVYGRDDQYHRFVLEEMDLGFWPAGMAYDPDTDQLYIARRDDDIRRWQWASNTAPVRLTNFEIEGANNRFVIGMSIYGVGDTSLFLAIQDSTTSMVRSYSLSTGNLITTEASQTTEGGIAFYIDGIIVRDYYFRDGELILSDSNNIIVSEDLGLNNVSGLAIHGRDLYVGHDNNIITRLHARAHLDEQGLPLNFGYTVRTRISKELNFPYHVRNLVTKTLNFWYNVGDVIQKRLDFSWSVHTKVPPKTLDFSYEVRRKVPEKTLDFWYTVRNRVDMFHRIFRPSPDRREVDLTPVENSNAFLQGLTYEDGKVYYLNRDNATVKYFDIEDRAVLTVFTSPTTANSGLALHNGNFYYYSTSGGPERGVHIGRADGSHEFLYAVPQGEVVLGLTIVQDRLAILETFSGGTRVVVLDPSADHEDTGRGFTVSTFAPTFGAIAYDTDTRTFYIAYNNRIYPYSEDGTLDTAFEPVEVTLPSGSTSITGLTKGPDNTFYYSVNGDVTLRSLELELSGLGFSWTIKRLISRSQILAWTIRKRIAARLSFFYQVQGPPIDLTDVDVIYLDHAVGTEEVEI